MSDTSFERIIDVLDGARSLSGEERLRYIDDACRGDDAFRAEVLSLLVHADADDAPVDGAAPGADAEALHALASDATGHPGGAAHAADDEAAPLPEAIGPFAIVRRLATGGMGTVYEAEQRDPARRVALKTLRPELFTPSLLKRFRREAQILGRLQHPGIAQVFEAGAVEHAGGTLPYFAMEFVDGKPLGAYAADEGLDERQRLTLFVQVCDAVHHAHSQGVVHRDLKPDNILVTAEGHPKVLDFGIARVTGSDVAAPTLVTEVGQVMGTLPYMSPEQVAGNPEDIDARSDVYALGVVLFELLAGRRPHELGELSLPDAARVIRDVEATRLGTVATRWRGDVETIVGKALEKDPARRYAGAEALAADVRRHLADQPINAHAPSRLYRLRKFTQRHTGLVVGTTLAVVALAVGLAFSVNFALDEARQRRAGEVTSYRALVTAATASLDNGELLAARGILDQTEEALRGWEWHHASARAEPLLWSVERNEVAGWEAPGWGKNGLPPTVFSPDDTLLAAPLAADRVGVFEAETGVRRFELALTGRLEKRTLVATARGFLTVTREGHVVHWDGATGEALAEDHVPGPITTVVWDETHGRLAAAAIASDGGEDRLLVGPLGAIEEIDHALFLGEGLGSHEPIGWCRDGRTLVGYGSALVDLPLRESGGAPTPSLRSALSARYVYACQGDRLLVLPSRRGGGDLALTDLGGDVLVDLESQTFPEITSTSLSRDQRRIAVTSGRTTRRTVSVHDAATGRAIARWPGPVGTRGDLSGQGRRLALGTLDRLQVISLDSSATSVLPGATEYVYDLAWTPDGRTLLARNFRYSARAYDVAEETVVFDLLSPGMRGGRLHAMTIRTWGLSSDGMRLVESYHPGKATAMKVATYDVVAGGPWEDVPGVGWESPEPDPLALLAASSIDMPRASRLEFLRVTGAIGPSTVDPAALALTRASSTAPRVLVDPSGTRVVDSIARAIEPVDGSPADRVPLTWSSQGEFRLQSSIQYADAHFSPDGRLLAVSRPTLHEGVVVHDTTSGAPVVELLADLETEPLFYAVAFSPDGTRLAVGGTGRVVSLFDTSDWALVTQLEGHRGYVKDIAWSPDGRTLATCGGDGTVRLWHTRTLAERTAAAHVAARRREEQRPAVEALFAQLDDPHAVAAAVRADTSLDDDDRHAALRCVRELADAWWAAREDAGGEPADR